MYDAAIVGAGPAGSTAATLLAKRGLRVLLLDRARFPRDKPCSEYLNSEATEVLRRSGALAAVDGAQPCLLNGMEVNTYGGQRYFIDLCAQGGSPARALERRRLDALLVDHARTSGADVVEGFRVENLTWTNGVVTGLVGSSNGIAHHYGARLVFGCDGTHSVVARRLGVAHDVWWLRRMSFVCHFSAVPDLQAFGEFHLERSYYVGVAPLGGGRANVTLVAPMADVQLWRGNAGAYVLGALQRLPRLWPRLARGNLEGPPRVYGPLARGVRRTSAPGVLLVGDSTGFLDPFTGEGLYTALRGAELAAQAVITTREHPCAAMVAPRQYDRARRRAFRHKRLVSSLVQLYVQHVWLSERAAYLFNRRPALLQTLAEVTSDRAPAMRLLDPRYLIRTVL
jgi:flavin-dependent dehydrogenase